MFLVKNVRERTVGHIGSVPYVSSPVTYIGRCHRVERPPALGSARGGPVGSGAGDGGRSVAYFSGPVYRTLLNAGENGIFSASQSVRLANPRSCLSLHRTLRRSRRNRSRSRNLRTEHFSRTGGDVYDGPGPREAGPCTCTACDWEWLSILDRTVVSRSSCLNFGSRRGRPSGAENTV